MPGLTFHKLASACRLPPRDLWAIAAAWWTLALTDLTVSLLPYRYWRRQFLEALTEPPVPSNHLKPQPVLPRLRQYRTALRNYPRPVNCLRRSLSLHRFLSRHGMAATLIVGTRLSQDGGLEGHAWLEADGQVINDNPDVRDRYLSIDKALPDSRIAGLLADSSD